MTKLKNCPLCGSSVALIEDTRAEWLWPVIKCPCKLTKCLPWATQSDNYAELTEQLIEQWNHRPQLEEAYEALRAYDAAATVCPGILIEPGVVSGCSHFDPGDCPTCAVIDAAENE